MICICESPNILSSFFLLTRHYNAKDSFSFSFSMPFLFLLKRFFLASLSWLLFNYRRSCTQLIFRSLSRVTAMGNFNAWSALPNDFIQRNNRSAICIQRFDPVNSWSFIPCLPIKEAVDRSKQFQFLFVILESCHRFERGYEPYGSFQMRPTFNSYVVWICGNKCEICGMCVTIKIRIFFN